MKCIYEDCDKEGSIVEIAQPSKRPVQFAACPDHTEIATKLAVKVARDK